MNSHAPTPDLHRAHAHERRNIELANALAADLLTLDEVLKQFDMTRRELEQLLSTGNFRRLLSNARAEWRSAQNSGERARIKSAMAFETSIPELVRCIHRGSQEPLSGRVEAAKLLARAGGVGEKSQVPVAAGEKFSVVVNIMGETPQVISKPYVTIAGSSCEGDSG
ncbi:hypothetical protein [Methylocella sp.]|uniref:hypothetical protein n=1 Tax=Methylocella sp. TaxID=1978226 RepID=UPI0035AF403F